MASLFVSGIGLSAEAIRTPEEINETIKLMFEGQDAETLWRETFRNELCDLDYNEVLEVLDKFYIDIDKFAQLIRSHMARLLRFRKGLMLTLYSQSKQGNLRSDKGRSTLEIFLSETNSYYGPSTTTKYRSAAETLGAILTKTPKEAATYINELSEAGEDKLKHLYLGCLCNIS